MLTRLGKVVKTNNMLENKIISAALSGHNFFVLGQAGTDKSTVIEEIYHMLTSLGMRWTNYMVKMCVRKQNYFGCSFSSQFLCFGTS